MAHAGLDEAGAKRLSHHLEKIVRECVGHFNLPEFKSIAKLIRVFPDVNARYQGNQYDSEALWNAYGAAQQAGTRFVRSVTDRDARPVIFRRNNPSEV